MRSMLKKGDWQLAKLVSEGSHSLAEEAPRRAVMTGQRPSRGQGREIRLIIPNVWLPSIRSYRYCKLSP